MFLSTEFFYLQRMRKQSKVYYFYSITIIVFSKILEEPFFRYT